MRESDPGQLGEKRERFLCAMPSPQQEIELLDIDVMKCLQRISMFNLAMKVLIRDRIVASKTCGVKSTGRSN